MISPFKFIREIIQPVEIDKKPDPYVKECADFLVNIIRAARPELQPTCYYSPQTVRFILDEGAQYSGYYGSIHQRVYGPKRNKLVEIKYLPENSPSLNAPIFEVEVFDKSLFGIIEDTLEYSEWTVTETDAY